MGKKQPLPRAMESEEAAEARSIGDWYKLIRAEVSSVDVFQRTDHQLVAHTARALYDRHQARKTCRETGGPILVDGKVNPWWKVEMKLADKVSQLLPKVGLTPDSRQKLQRAPKQQEQPPSLPTRTNAQ